MWQDYINANSIEQALSILSNYEKKAKLVAGATDLMLELERGQHDDLHVLVDISRIQGQNRIRLDGRGYLHLGAMVTHNDCVASSLLRQYALPLVLASWEVGSPQIRNRGTVAGNLITASPANDTITPLMALDADLIVKSLHGTRVIPLREFYKGVRSTQLKPDEIVVEIVFKALLPSQRGIFLKVALRQAQAISVVNVAVILELSGDQVQQARITLGAVAPTIIRAQEAEKFLEGKSLNDESIQKAAQLAAHSSKPISDIRGSADYRKWMTQVITRRAIQAIWQETNGTKLPAKPALLRGNSEFVKNPVDQGKMTVRVNGRIYQFHETQAKSLLDLLREDVGLTGTKEGCAEGECGACTVFMDGAAVMSCLVPAPRANGVEIVTIEGLAPTDELHPVQKAFIEAGAVQCGYCTPGLIMSSAKLLEEIAKPSKNQITQALTGNLCRCTGYYKIIEAVERAAGGM